jgi:FPC/CPF motif-containing protein YcgG
MSDGEPRKALPAPLAALPLPPDDFDDSGRSHPTASAYSNYSGIVQHDDSLDPQKRTPQYVDRLYKIPVGQLWPTEHCERVIPLAQTAHDSLRGHILNEFYPCVGARAAFHSGTYRFGFYKELAHPTSVLAQGHDLKRFVKEYEKLGDFTTFVSIFKYPQSTNEQEFEDLLWKHLQALHELDGTKWDPHYDPDPQSPYFAFSFAGCAFFLVGMHSGASRFSRRLDFAALIFNPESQIHRLKREGQFDHMAEMIRKRDVRFQGSVNPSIPQDPASQENESGVYSGKANPPGTFRCPFHARQAVLDGHVRVPPDITPKKE